MNIMTAGKYNQVKRQLNYDDMFHLYLIVKLENGMNLLMEKNQVVNIEPYKFDIDKDCKNIKLNKDITFTQLLLNGEKFQGDTFWKYHPKTNNCQNFVLSLLKGNNLGDDSLYSFVKQDANQLFTPLAEKITSGVINLAGRFDVLLKGTGFEDYL